MALAAPGNLAADEENPACEILNAKLIEDIFTVGDADDNAGNLELAKVVAGRVVKQLR